MALVTFLVQVGSTLAMVGLIWFVQVVHYPMFESVGAENFERYERQHQRLTTLVVVPFMVCELISAVLLLSYCPIEVDTLVIWSGIALVATIWLVTFFVQVPQHALLENGFDAEVHQSLVAGNWWRTVLWTVRGTLVLWMVGQMASHPIGQAIAK